MILVICDEGRYIPVQFVNPPDFSAFDLPRCLQLVKQNRVYSIHYLAKKEV